MSKRIELPVGPVDQVAQVAPLRAEEPPSVVVRTDSARREMKPEPRQEIWPEDFDRTVVLSQGNAYGDLLPICSQGSRPVHRKSLLTRRTRERFNTEARRLRGTECFELPSAVRGGFAAEGCEVGGYNRWNLRIRIA